MQYLTVIEKTETGYSAYSPDLDGCVATGSTKSEVEENMREAARKFEFEKAAQLRDRVKLLRLPA